MEMMRAALASGVPVSEVLGGAAPLNELSDVVESVELVVAEEARRNLGVFQEAASQLKRLLREGGRPAQFLAAQKLLEDTTRGISWKPQEATMPLPSNYHLASALNRVDSNVGRELGLLEELVAISSISCEPEEAKEVRHSAEWVAQKMREANFANVRLLEAEGVHPAVYGEIIVDPNKSTILFYAHHDVMPLADNGKGWETDPFKAIVRNGRLYGRGAADDKAGFISGLAAIKAYGQNLPVNVVFLIEGEEETGSENLDRLLAQLPPDLKIDAALLANSENSEETSDPWVGDFEHPITNVLAGAFAMGYGQPNSVLAGTGGSIGFLPTFKKRFPNTPLYCIGIEDPDTNAHAANESLSISDFWRTIRSLVFFFHAMGNRT